MSTATTNSKPATSSAENDSFLMNEETIWKKYNSHHEFPLSVAVSVALHVFAALFVAFLGVWLLQWNSNPNPPDLGNITFAGGGGSGEGGGDPNGPETNQEAINFSDDTVADDMPKANIDLNQLPSENITSSRAIEQAKKTDQLAKGINDPRLLAGDKGRGGSGRGGGKGEGFGTGEGDGAGPGKMSKREQRALRWVISIQYRDGEEFVEKWAELNAMMVVSETPGNYLIFRDLKQKPPKGEAIDQQGIVKLNRLWYSNRDQKICEMVALTMNLSRTPKFVGIFIPQDLEAEMLKKETEYRRLSEDQIRAQGLITEFSIGRRGNGWDVRVNSQKKKGT